MYEIFSSDLPLAFYMAREGGREGRKGYDACVSTNPRDGPETGGC